jgi:hypothetical protein
LALQGFSKTTAHAQWSKGWRFATSALHSFRPEVLSSLLVSVRMPHMFPYMSSNSVVVGCLMAAYINNMIGRRLSLVLSAVISLIGVTIEATSAIGSPARYNQFVVGKVIASIAMGMVVNIRNLAPCRSGFRHQSLSKCSDYRCYRRCRMCLCYLGAKRSLILPYPHVCSGYRPRSHAPGHSSHPREP